MESMDAGEHQILDRYAPDTGLARVIRIPVRIVVLVVVLPVRMVRDLLAAGWHPSTGPCSARRAGGRPGCSGT
ncbi:MULTISPECIES: hypothetical protein [Streptomyces]|uniref:hypothetical protein n=1 Tax=Streptomyces TaxID=1883 RepID=UPI001CEF750C|nr:MULTISPECIES: hypothetical protein [Streptomyces]